MKSPPKASLDARLTAPTPDQLKAARVAAKLTQTEAGALVHTTCRVWQQWEAGDRGMHLAFWELFRLKADPSTNTKTTRIT